VLVANDHNVSVKCEANDLRRVLIRKIVVNDNKTHPKIIQRQYQDIACNFAIVRDGNKALRRLVPIVKLLAVERLFRFRVVIPIAISLPSTLSTPFILVLIDDEVRPRENLISDDLKPGSRVELLAP